MPDTQVHRLQIGLNETEFALFQKEKTRMMRAFSVNAEIEISDSHTAKFLMFRKSALEARFADIPAGIIAAEVAEALHDLNWQPADIGTVCSALIAAGEQVRHTELKAQDI